MTDIGTVTLETERLILQRFTPTDADAMFRNWANSDAEIAKYLDYQPDGSFGVINTWIEEYGLPHRYNWAIVLRESGEPIGYINAHDIDEFADSLEVGYAIGQSFWHRGIMTEALNRVISFFFEEVGVRQIIAKHRPANPRSGGVMLNTGMSFLGVRRNALRVYNSGTDLHYYTITAKDYFSGGGKPQITIVPYSDEYRGDTLFCYLSAKDAVNKYAPMPHKKPTLREDMLDIPKHYLQRGEAFYLALDENARVVGMLGTKTVSANDLWLQRLFVKPELKGRGIGSRLLAEVERYAADKGIATIHTRFAPWYREAARFYPAKGFTEAEPYGDLRHMMKIVIRN